MSLSVQRQFRFAGFVLDPMRRILERNGDPVALTPKAFDVLIVLVSNAGRIVTKEELLKTVWSGSFVEEGNLTQHVSALRKALADRSGLIVTVPGRGYQFTAQVEDTGTPIPPAFPAPGAGLLVHRVRERAHLVVTETVEPLPQSGPPPDAASHPLAQAGQPTRRSFWLRWTGFLIAGLLAASWLGRSLWHRFHPSPADHHQAVLASLENKTGDPGLDQPLNRAFKIDLEQSPYLDLMGDRDVAQTLKLMGRETDPALEPAVAREVCIRGNRQVLLTGSIYSLGNLYLVTVEATDCRTGKQVVSAAARATSKARIADALDSAVGRIRSGLGESDESVQRNEVPIEEATTPSLEALTFYSEATHLDNRRTHASEVLPLYRRATEVDPNFAMAFVALAEEYRRLGESDTAAQYFKRAFELRQHVSPHERLIIEAQYYSAGIGDLPRALEAYRLWSATFPYDSMPRAEPVRLYLELGQYADAIDAGEHAVRFNPENVFGYQRLMLAYIRAGRFQDAKSLLARAQADRSDSETMHRFAFLMALAEHDPGAQLAEIQRPKPQGAATYGLDFLRACAAATAGHLQQAHALFLAADNEVQVEQLPEELGNFLTAEAEMQQHAGLLADARKTLAQARALAVEPANSIALRVALGDTAAGEKFIAAHENDADTLVHFVYVPRVRATLALERRKPLDAVAALELARPYELRDYEVPALRGEAYLQANQPALAAREFEKILANPGIDPVSMLYPLAHRGLARARLHAGDRPGAAAEYKALLALWRDADPELPLLTQIRQEDARSRP
jgi:DNA-binding winged helix-turn-helix (wHTH) protein/tetratricopeptide (TPR) repeat protein